LEHVLRVLPPAQQSLAHAQDHRPVPVYQFLERRLIALAGEALEQIAVGWGQGFARPNRLAEMIDDGTKRLGNHDGIACKDRRIAVLYHSLRGQRVRLKFFLTADALDAPGG